MRSWLAVVVVVVAACKGTKEKASSSALAMATPTVDVASVLANDEPTPPFLMVVDARGVRLAAAASWADLDANKVRIAKDPAPLEATDRFIREENALARGSVESIKRWDDFVSSPVAIDLASLEEASLSQDDPPPPEEEDMPEDGSEESGGTGTAMALEEGKLGKLDSDRAEGQYRMRRSNEDPQLARQQAIEQARAAGILGGGVRRDGAPTGANLFLDPPTLNEDGTPARVAQVTGAVITQGPLDQLRVMVLVAPTSKARELIAIVSETEGAIAVSHAGKIRPLRLHFRQSDGREPEHWLEARVSTKSVTVEGVPEKPIEVAELKDLASALEHARSARGIDADDALVDVLVDSDVEAQRLVDVLVALDTAGVRTIGMGPMPSAEELARRGRRIPTTRLGHPNSQGDLSKAVIRRVVKSGASKIRACYTSALAGDPTLTGTVQVQFLISPNGEVMTAMAAGVSPALATCVNDVIKSLQFPKPGGGGGVQVIYPFTFRP